MIEVPCPHAGKVEKIHVSKGDTVKVGQTLLTIDADASEPRAEAAGRESPNADAGQGARRRGGGCDAGGGCPAPSHAASRRADSGRAGRAARGPRNGRGPEPIGRFRARGRITVEDVKAAPRRPAGIAPATGPAAPIGEPVIPPGEPGKDRMAACGSRRCRKSAARSPPRWSSRQARSRTSPISTTPISVLEQMRKSVPAGYLGPDIKLTTMPFVMKAVAAALRQHPLLNATIDDQN